jgi:hypothetical protein
MIPNDVFIWLVVWNFFYFSLYWETKIPTDELIFFWGMAQPPTSYGTKSKTILGTMIPKSKTTASASGCELKLTWDMVLGQWPSDPSITPGKNAGNGAWFWEKGKWCLSELAALFLSWVCENGVWRCCTWPSRKMVIEIKPIWHVGVFGNGAYSQLWQLKLDNDDNPVVYFKSTLCSDKASQYLTHCVFETA